MKKNTIFFVVEVEHENDDQARTIYNRRTLHRKIYTSRSSAEQACVSLQSRWPLNDRGFRQGENGEVYHQVIEATVEDSYYMNFGERRYSYDKEDYPDDDDDQ